MSETIAARILFLLLLSAALLLPVDAREIPLPEEEAPSSLFSAELGGSDAQLFLEGRWKSELSAGFGYTYDSGTGELYPSSLPELSDGIAFSQMPNLTLSLWLQERYFFETVITEEQELETFLFGYNGEQGDPVEKVRMGNSDLGMGDFGYLSLPAASSDSFGAYGLFNGPSSTHHLALRFDPAGKAHKAYIGHNQVEEQRLSPEGFLRGRFFVLPDANVSNLRVFMEHEDGTYSAGGTTFKELGAEEMSVSAEEGLVYLREPANGRVAVWYNGLGAVGNGTGALAGTNGGYIDLDEPNQDFAWEVTDTGPDYLGINFDTERQISIDGNDCLLLHVPGQWSPFELESVYRPKSRPDETEKLEVQLVQKEARSGERVDFLLFQEELIRLPAGGSIRDPAARYPLAEYVEDEEAYYGPEAPGLDGDPERQLLFQRLSPVSAFLQEEEALAGSIEVLRDGRQVSAYTFDPATGEVSFFYPVGENERIDIYYRSPNAASAGSGDLLAASANRFRFSEQLSGSLDLGLRWNVGGQSYTVEQEEAEGSILTSGGLEYERERFGASVQAAVGIHNPNTTGYRRLLGMGEGGVPVPLLPDGLYPAPPLSSLSLSHPAGRGPLLYRDYYSSSFAGGRVLQKYTWDPPADQTYAYGERVGPYLAATGSETSGNTAVFAYDLGGNEWAGGMIPLVKGEEPLDLSGSRALTFQARHLGLEPGDTAPDDGNVTVHVVFGLLPEDLDDDGVLEEEDSRYDDGFSFDHGSYGTMPVAPVLPWAAESSAKDGEDLNGNGVLGGSVVTVVKSSGSDFTLPSGGAGWTRIRLPLSPGEREKLTAVTAVAVYIEDDGTAESGRLLLANLSFAGSSFSVSPGGTDLTMGTRLLDSGTGGYEQLLAFEEAARFNGSSPISVPVSRAEWGSGGTWSATGYFDPADLEDYRSLSFFMRVKDDTPDPLSLKLTNPSGEGLGVSFTPAAADNTWRRYTWNLDTGEVSADGTDQGATEISSGGGFRRKRNAAGVTRFRMEAGTSGSGELEIDEVHLHDPQTAVNAGGRGSIRWEYPEPVITAGEAPLLHGIRIESSVHGETGPLAAGFTTPDSSRAGTENLLSFKSLGLSADISLDADLYEDRVYTTGGYSLSLPLLEKVLRLRDSYDEGLTEDTERTVARSSSVRAEGSAGSAVAEFQLRWDGDELERSWRAEGSVTPAGPFSADASLELGAVNTGAPLFTLDDFSSRFGSTYPLYLTRHTSGEGPKRSQEASAAVTVSRDRFSLRLADTVSTRTEAAETYRLSGSNVLSADLSLSPAGGENRGQYSFGYTRTLEHAAPHGGSPDYTGDAETALKRIGSQDYLWNSVPLAELWNDTARSSFTSASERFTDALYATEVNAGYSRSPGSTLAHLFLPGHLHFGALREIEREQDTVRDTLELDGSVRTTALNLFGRLGRYSLFSWYRTEEISHTFGYTSLLPLASGGSDEEQHTLSVRQFIELQIAEERRITWEAGWEMVLPESNQEFSLSAEWRHSPGRVSFPAFLEMLKETGKPRLVHSEKLDLRYIRNRENGEQELSPLLRHTTEFLFDELGSIGLTAALGYLRRDSAARGAALHTFGGELGIRADFSF